MIETPKKPLHWLNESLWAVVWGTVLTTFMVFAIQANNPCFLIVNGASWMWTISGLLWLWITLFLFFGNKGRLTLLGFTMLAFLAYPHVDRVPVAAGEGRAVMHIRRLLQSVDSYRREHPMEGYPPNLPTISKGEDSESTERLYKIVYTATRSNSGGPVDRFVIQANPLWRDCGYVRSFAATDAGEIHFTLEPRPATKSDPTIQ